MIEGQQMDLSFEAEDDVPLPQYLMMAERKTGALMGAALELGALAAEGGRDQVAACRHASCRSPQNIPAIPSCVTTSASRDTGVGRSEAARSITARTGETIFQCARRSGVRIVGAGAKSDRPWVFMELLDTALGASSKQDGVSLIHGTLGVGQFRPGPVEIHETEFPMRVVRFDVRADSGGPGKFRGGLGCTREYQLLKDAAVRVRGKGDMRSKMPPWGVFGGHAARVGGISVNGEEVPETAREVRVKPGDIVRVNMNAGGGYGDPLERDPELVLGDVLDGYVTPQGARDDYGVVIDPDSFRVDYQATEKLRQERR